MPALALLACLALTYSERLSCRADYLGAKSDCYYDVWLTVEESPGETVQELRGCRGEARRELRDCLRELERCVP